MSGDRLREAAQALLDAEAEPAYSWVIESRAARAEGRPNREVERVDRIARARRDLAEALAADERGGGEGLREAAQRVVQAWMVPTLAHAASFDGLVQALREALAADERGGGEGLTAAELYRLGYDSGYLDAERRYMVDAAAQPASHAAEGEPKPEPKPEDHDMPWPAVDGGDV